MGVTLYIWFHEFLTIQVQFYLHFSWLDSRLTFFDLRDNPALNSLSPQEKELLWVPVLVFDNTENKVTTLVDDKATITIRKEGKYYLSGLDEHNNHKKYQGAENLINLSRFYNIRYQHTFFVKFSFIML